MRRGLLFSLLFISFFGNAVNRKKKHSLSVFFTAAGGIDFFVGNPLIINKPLPIGHFPPNGSACCNNYESRYRIKNNFVSELGSLLSFSLNKKFMIQSGLALDIVRYKMINESPLPHCPDVPFVPIIRRTYCFIKIPLYFSMQLQGFILSGGIKFDVDNSPLLSTQFMYKLMHNKPV